MIRLYIIELNVFGENAAGEKNVKIIMSINYVLRPMLVSSVCGAITAVLHTHTHTQSSVKGHARYTPV